MLPDRPRSPLSVLRLATAQRRRSGRTMRILGTIVGVGTAATPVVIRPMLLPERSVNQRFPSAPAAIRRGWLFDVGSGNSLTIPGGVIRPILSAANSVN